jgi:rhodanese-related sulfurtransferase
MADTPMEIDCRATKALLDANEDFLFLDCREPDEYETVCIPGTLLLPMSELPARVVEIADHKDRAIIVHCHHGSRSLRVANWLRNQGFSRAQSMAGGIDQWSLEIDPSLPRY